MKLLHTADWHVGKTVRGASRADEHEAVLAEIVGIAEREAVDLVLVVGDLFDTAAPTPTSERIVYRALLDLAADDRQVVVVAGNHDNARRLEAIAPVFEPAGIQIATKVVPPERGGVLALEVGGTAVRLALLPFLSQRHVVGVDELMAAERDEHAQSYDDRVRRILEALCSGWDEQAAGAEATAGSPAVNVVVAHAHVAGGVTGGGERSAHTIFDYAVSPLAFPSTAHYVALGHLHRTQRVEGPTRIWYPGSPLQMDFGEADDTKNVLLVEVEPNRPADVRPQELASGRRFRTVAGTLAELAELAARAGRADDDGTCSVQPGLDHLRVVVAEPSRVGLADEVRALFPTAVEVRVEPPEGTTRAELPDPGVDQRNPTELFAGYLADRGIDDPRLGALFGELLQVASEQPGGPA